MHIERSDSSGPRTQCESLRHTTWGGNGLLPCLTYLPTSSWCPLLTSEIKATWKPVLWPCCLWALRMSEEDPFTWLFFLFILQRPKWPETHEGQFSYLNELVWGCEMLTEKFNEQYYLKHLLTAGLISYVRNHLLLVQSIIPSRNRNFSALHL
jgi:hypothetical protein